MVKSIYLGVDPGSSSGTIAWILETNGGMIQTDCIRFKNATEKEISDKLKQLASYGGKMFAVVEKTWSMPQEGVSSAFTFGDNCGWIRGTLMALNIPFDTVLPQRWQKEFVPPQEGRKNLNKETKEQVGWDRMSPVAQKELKKKFDAHNGILKAEHKKKLKTTAEALFPNVKILSDTGEAFLLATYCKRYHNN